MQSVRFEGRNAQFFSTLRSRIDQYFQENDLRPTGNWKLYHKTLVLAALGISTYVIWVFFNPGSLWIDLLLTFLMGVSFAGIGFNVMHDGAHGSYSRKSWVNNLMAYSLNVLGGNAHYWHEKHNVAHHSFTNINGVDEDIDAAPMMRMNTGQPRKWFHRFQHIYVWPLYSFAYLAWIFYQDFAKYFSGKIAVRDMKEQLHGWGHVGFWGSKIAYISLFIVLPIYMLGWPVALGGYFCLSLTTGIFITTVFQMAHVVENMDFITGTEDLTTVPSDWASHQVQTTSNFATKNRFWAWMLGGLNFQVEHHLFPKISHIHYPKLNEIVKKTCEEFQVRYQEFPTFLAAIRSHIAHLKAVGQAA